MSNSRDYELNSNSLTRTHFQHFFFHFLCLPPPLPHTPKPSFYIKESGRVTVSLKWKTKQNKKVFNNFKGRVKISFVTFPPPPPPPFLLPSLFSSFQSFSPFHLSLSVLFVVLLQKNYFNLLLFFALNLKLTLKENPEVLNCFSERR